MYTVNTDHVCPGQSIFVVEIESALITPLYSEVNLYHMSNESFKLVYVFYITFNMFLTIIDPIIPTKNSLF